jgi:hypothetical protein
MDIHERLRIFFERLSAAPGCRSASEALALVCRLIEEVEDEHCPVARQNPPPRTRTGRMYAPQSDFIFPLDDSGIRAETRRHIMMFSADGSIRITATPPAKFEFSKKGGTL